MQYEEFFNLVKHGMEYNFYIDDEEYWISHNLSGYYVTKVKNSYTQSFITCEELFENARINEKTILELWKIIQEYC